MSHRCAKIYPEPQACAEERGEGRFLSTKRSAKLRIWIPCDLIESRTKGIRALVVRIVRSIGSAYARPVIVVIPSFLYRSAVDFARACGFSSSRPVS